MSRCPDAEALHDFLADALPSEENARIESHLIQCRLCIEVISTLNLHETTAAALQSLAADSNDLDPTRLRQLIGRVRGELREDNALYEHATVDVPADGIAVAPADGEAAPIEFLEPPQSADEIGRLGGFRILEVLGKGGMGIVFRAHDTHLDRMVALKVMLPSLAADETARQRFLREAKATAALSHDNIVSIHQVGEANGAPFIAMPLLKGHTLDVVLKKGKRLGLPAILRIAEQTARGLAAAHEAGLVHRDIKPSNLWIEPDGGGRVKIVDFGLARASHADKEKGREEMRLTKSGMILGTPAYMSPEQARGEGEVDHRCDLFSLGCVLYEMCTGELPFRGADITGILLSLVMDDPLPPHKIRDEIPLELSDFIMKLLNKEPADRPQSAQDVGAFIRQLQRQVANRNQASAGPTEAIPAPDDAERTTPTGVPVARETTVAPKRRRLWPFFVVLFLLFASFAIFFGPASIRFASNQGQLVIETDQHVTVTLLAGAKKIDVFEMKSRQTVGIAAGKRFKLRIERMSDGVEIDTDVFKLVRGGRIVFNVREEMRKAGDSGVPAKKQTGINKQPTAKQQPVEVNGEFTPIFNGKDLNGLNIWWGPKHWHVNDGNLIGKGTAAIGTTKTYRDYVLKFDVRYPDDKNPGRASVFLHAGLNDKKSLNDFIQINIGEPRLGEIMVKMGNRSPTTNASQELVKKAIKPGWNTYQIMSKNGEMTVALNGVEISRADSPIIREGNIGFHAITTPVEFRNIGIKVLKQELQPEPEWTNLFNGKDLTGFEVSEGGKWSAKDGILVGRGGMLTTSKSYKDYHLQFDARRTEPDDKQSFIVHVHWKLEAARDFAPRFTIWNQIFGLGSPQIGEMKIQNGSSSSSGMTPGSKHQSSEKALKSGWNTFDITSRSGFITCKLNGVLISSGQGKLTEGHIGLSTRHGPRRNSPGSPVEFRNIRIKEFSLIAVWLKKLGNSSPFQLKLRRQIEMPVNLNSTRGATYEFTGDAKILVRTSGSRGYTCWDVRDGKQLYGMKAPVFSSEHQLLAYHYESGYYGKPRPNVYVSKFPSNLSKPPSFKLPCNPNLSFNYAFVPKKPFIAAANSTAGNLQIWHLDQKKMVHSLDQFDGRLLDAEFSSDGTRVAVRTVNSISIWDWGNGKKIFSTPSKSPYQMLGGSLVGVQQPDGDKWVFRRLDTGELYSELKLKEFTAASPDGKAVINISTPGRVPGALFGVVIDTNTGKQLGKLTPRGGIGRLYSFQFTGDGKWILARQASGEYALEIWDAKTYKPVQSISIPKEMGRLSWYAISPGGELLALVIYKDYRRTIYVFDVVYR